MELEPEATSLASKASTLSSHGEVGARESSSSEVNSSQASATSNKSNIGHSLLVGPVAAQDRRGLRVDLGLQGALHPGPVEGQIDAAAPRKERDVLHFQPLALIPSMIRDASCILIPAGSCPYSRRMFACFTVHRDFDRLSMTAPACFLP